MGAAAVAVVPERKLVRVLVIDDEVDFQQSMTDYFDAYGYSVDVARDPEEAKVLLEKNKYQIALVDVNFEGINVKGDRFVLNNHADFKGARVVVVTGRNINTMRYRRALENLDILVWDKGGENWGRDLTGLTEETAEARKQEIAGQMNALLSTELGAADNYVVTGISATAVATAVAPEPTAVTEPEPWSTETKEIFIGWLESLSDPERPFFSIGRQVLSPRSMVEHVKDRTDLGKELLDMFVAEVRYSMGLGDRPSSERDEKS